MEIIGKKIDPKSEEYRRSKNEKSKNYDIAGKVFKLDNNTQHDQQIINWNLRMIPIEKTTIPPIKNHKWAVQDYKQQYITTFQRHRKDYYDYEMDNSSNSYATNHYNDFCVNSLRETKLLKRKKPEMPPAYELNKFQKFISLKKTSSEPKNSPRHNKENNSRANDFNSTRNSSNNTNILPSTKRSKDWANKTSMERMALRKKTESLCDLQTEKSEKLPTGKISKDVISDKLSKDIVSDKLSKNIVSNKLEKSVISDQFEKSTVSEKELADIIIVSGKTNVISDKSSNNGTLDKCSNIDVLDKTFNNEVLDKCPNTVNQELDNMSNASKALYAKINKLNLTETLDENKDKSEKKPKKYAIKVCLHMVRGEASLFNYFFENGIFARARKPQDSYYCHFSQDREQNFEFAEFTIINRIPGIADLCNKNFTFRILNEVRKLHEEKFNFYPKTFILPDEYDNFKEFHKSNPKEIMIAKLGAGCHGFGCKILRKPKELPDIVKDKTERIVQSYIDNPLLLNGRKNDLRIYCTIVSYKPLVAFINREGLARFCTEPYKTAGNLKCKINEYEHLSNYTQNKNAQNYVQADNVKEINNGTKRSFISYFKEIEQMGLDKEKMWDQIKKTCAGCLKAMKPYILYACKKEWKDNNKVKCCHIIGVDILFDSDLNAHLLEINSNPSLNIDLNQEDAKEKKVKPFFKTEKERLEEFEISKIDLYVKKKVLGDAVRLYKNNSMKKIKGGDFQNYRSYEKVYDETIESEQFGDVNQMEKILEMFMALSGVKFNPALTQSKFSKCVKWFDGLGETKLQLFDADMAFKNAFRKYEILDFDAFSFALQELVSKAYGLDRSSDALSYLDEQYDRFNSLRQYNS